MSITRGRPSYHQGFARSAGESAYPGLWQGLIGAWVPALGPTGNILRDVSGFGNHGTLTTMNPDTDWIISGDSRVPGYTLDYDGGDDVVIITDNPVLNFGTGDFSVLFWTNPTRETGTAALVSKRAGATGTEAGWGIGTRVPGTDNSQIYIGDGTSGVESLAVTSATFYGGGWHLVAVTFDRNDTASWFTDGVFEEGIGDISALGSVDVSTDVCFARYGSGSLEYDGSISSVFLYNRLVTVNEMLLHYQIFNAPFILRRRVVGFVAAAAAARPKALIAMLHQRRFPLVP